MRTTQSIAQETVLNRPVAKLARTSFRPTDSDGILRAAGTVSGRLDYRPAIVLTFILLVFILLQCLLPLRTAVKIGADEGFELAKATLCLHGYKLYSEIWNDQPPLHTFLITQVLRHVSRSVLGPRLLTTAFAAILLIAVFLASLRIHGLLAATLATVWLMASPGFLELSCSVMQEVPALAPAIGALSLLLFGRRTPWRLAEILAGILFAAALQMKFIGAIYLPLAGLTLWLRDRTATLPASRRNIFSTSHRYLTANLTRSLLFFGTSLAITFVTIDWLIDDCAYIRHFQQSWAAHFARARSFEYGSPDDYPFDWSVLLKNWDTTIPAVLGLIVAWRQIRQQVLVLIPLTWLALSVAVFGVHKPWWSYYYVHNAVPLCWCAAIGIAGAVQWTRERRSLFLALLLGIVGLGTAGWMGARVYLQITSIRHSPPIYTALVLPEIERLKPFIKFLYTDDPVYSFHTSIPLPPKLGVVSFKRFWSGDLTNARLAEELEMVKPGILLLKSGTYALPYSNLISAEYRLIYEDADHRLYAHKTVLTRWNG